MLEKRDSYNIAQVLGKGQGFYEEIFSDVKTAADVFTDIRRARKEGTVVEIRKSRVLPVFTAGPCIFDTVEGCTLWNRNKEVFDSLSVIARTDKEGNDLYTTAVHTY